GEAPAVLGAERLDAEGGARAGAPGEDEEDGRGEREPAHALTITFCAGRGNSRGLDRPEAPSYPLLRAMECPNCRRERDPESLASPGAGAIVANGEKRPGAPPAAPAPAAAEEPELTRDEAVWIPLGVFAAALFLAWGDLGRFFVQSALSMQLHELGHA